MVIPFEEFRKVKDRLPHGSIRKIAAKCSVDEETVRNYFGGTHYDTGHVTGIHFEKGINGGLVQIDDPTIFECARHLLDERAN